MKLILHIGTEKTGSTSIQKFLLKNKMFLENQNILLPNSIINKIGNHRWGPVLAYEDDFEDIFTKRIFKKNKTIRKKLICEKLNQFKKEISNSTADICVLSSEHFSSQLRRVEEIYKLNQILKKLFDEISIIVYIRNPIEAAISLLSTHIKCGGVPNGLNIEFFANRINNLKIIENWESIFLRENLKIKLFNKEEFIDGNLIKDFCLASNIKLSSEFIFPGKVNESLSLDQMKYLNYLNQYFPPFINDRVNKERSNLTKFVLKNFKSSSRFLPTKKEYDLFKRYFKFDNDIIRKKYFPERDELWLPFKKKFTEKENLVTKLSPTEINFLNAIKEIWSKK